MNRLFFKKLYKWQKKTHKTYSVSLVIREMLIKLPNTTSHPLKWLFNFKKNKFL